MPSLLAIDLGLRTGFALYGDDGRLRWYRSQHFGSAARLKRGVRPFLDTIGDLAWVVLEGGGDLATVWLRDIERRGIGIQQISAEAWRTQLLYEREQRSGVKAKQHADDLARRVIVWSGAARPTSLRHDAAEAILIGLWGVLAVGWLERMPAEVRRQ
ncbi:MAG: hypothetical protein HC876_02045 [Chloroflexaceae bacterium]|nr:hypothetical protein [Chloroflexaceae bacterium]NJO04399.1 hypothetical protein [Chloroflexaceae bacterium]